VSADLQELRRIAARIRGTVVEMSHRAETPHLGSSLSCVDIVVAAYWAGLRVDPANPWDPGRDRFILSKGHAATTLYAALAFRGFLPEDMLPGYAKDGSPLQEHPGPRCVPGVEAATGSLGHGLGLGLGMALAGRSQNLPFRVTVVMSDGECNEGSSWEAAMFGAARKLSSVTVFVDYNKWQATARSEQVLALKPLRDKWAACGWSAEEIDGHDMAALVDAMNRPADGEGRPRVFVCHTVKGKGVSFMEDDNNWHYRIPTGEEVLRARSELGLA
jgi:transketolase